MATKKKTTEKKVEISMENIKTLRAKTSAGMALCKEALDKSGGDMEKAIEYINERSDVISRLYNTTGAKIGLCKIAFEEANKDFQKAVEIINKRGWAGDSSEAAQKAKPVREGVIGNYVHGVNQKIVALVEVFCDTDFVARDPKFLDFAHDLAMQVAANKAKYVDKNDVPADILDCLKKEMAESPDLKGKPENIVEKIIEGKLQKFYEENCLLEQKFFKDETKMVRDLLSDVTVKLGEKIAIGRIYRMELGA